MSLLGGAGATDDKGDSSLNAETAADTGRMWKRSDGVDIYDEGANHVPARFENNKEVQHHYNKHKHHYPGWTVDQYIAEAGRLASLPVDKNILGFSTNDGCIVRYVIDTNDFVKAYPGNNGCIITLFKPTLKYAYYNNEKKDTWKYRKGK